MQREELYTVYILLNLTGLIVTMFNQRILETEGLWGRLETLNRKFSEPNYHSQDSSGEILKKEHDTHL